MTDFEILLLINANEKATEALSEFTVAFEAELTDNDYRPHDEVGQVAANVKPLIAFYLANAIAWEADRSGHVKYKRSTDDDSHPPSQVDGKVIKELKFLAEFMSKSPDKSRVRGRKSISLYAVRELQKRAALGRGVASHARAIDIAEQTTPGITRLGLGGRSISPPSGGTVSGFVDPGMITKDISSNVRLVNRLTARAADVGETPLLKIEPVRWGLSPAVVEILATAERTPDGEHVCLGDVKSRLDDDGRQNLAFCAAQASELLKITFHMTNQSEIDHSNKTIQQWMYAPPLTRFVVGIFELLTPTLGVAFDRIKLAQTVLRTKTEMSDGRNFDQLSMSAWSLAHAGYDCARAIVRAVPELRGIDLDVGAAIMERSEEEQKQSRRLREKEGLKETAEDIRSRLEAGRDNLIASAWTLRHDMLTLRGYEVFFAWYSSILMEPLPPLLFSEFLRQILNEIQDWSRELEARYNEGILAKRDIKRHAGGVPLKVLKLAPLVQRHTLEVIEYPGWDFGATMNEAIILSLLDSLSVKHPDVKDVWKHVTKRVQPIPLAGPR